MPWRVCRSPHGNAHGDRWTNTQHNFHAQVHRTNLISALCSGVYIHNFPYPDVHNQITQLHPEVLHESVHESYVVYSPICCHVHDIMRIICILCMCVYVCVGREGTVVINDDSWLADSHCMAGSLTIPWRVCRSSSGECTWRQVEEC